MIVPGRIYGATLLQIRIDSSIEIMQWAIDPVKITSVLNFSCGH